MQKRFVQKSFQWISKFKKQVKQAEFQLQSTSRKRIAGALLSVVLLTSCAATSKKELPVGHREGQWHGNISIKDKQSNKTHYLVMDVLGREPNELRLEITTQLGIPLASVVMNRDRVQALLPHQNRFIDAPATAQSMAKIAHVPVEPQILLDLFFDNQLTERKGWKCDSAAEQRCTHSGTQAGVVWNRRDGDPRQFSLESPRADGSFSIHEVQTKVEFNDNTFHLTAPESYKVEKL